MPLTRVLILIEDSPYYYSWIIGVFNKLELTLANWSASLDTTNDADLATTQQTFSLLSASYRERWWLTPCRSLKNTLFLNAYQHAAHESSNSYWRLAPTIIHE